MNSLWRAFFGLTRASYHAQRAARTFRAIASGSPKRIAKLYERRFLYRGFSRLVNRLLK
jgi:hypothetical protein